MHKIKEEEEKQEQKTAEARVEIKKSKDAADIDAVIISNIM
jgi:hypothetical protein